MLAQTAAEKNSAPELIPAVTPRMPWRVEHVDVLDGFRLKVRFIDGLEGVVDLKALVHAEDAGVFSVLADPAAFSKAYVEYGAVVWPCGLDLAPDAMHRAIRTNGVWTL